MIRMFHSCHTLGRRLRSLPVLVGLCSAILAIPAEEAYATHQKVDRVSESSSGAEANGGNGMPTVSSDGRYVAFTSSATNLVSGDSNGKTDVFLKDTTSGNIELVSISSGGTQGNDIALRPRISDDGRYIVYDSRASNLVAGDINNDWDVFLRDRQGGTTVLVSVDSTGSWANGDSWKADVSDDGRYVTFESWATDLIASDTNGWEDVFIRDMVTGSTSRIQSGLSQPNGPSFSPTISGTGSRVALNSSASNLITGDTNGLRDVFVWTRTTGSIVRVSVTAQGTQSSASALNGTISDSGEQVVFECNGLVLTDLTPLQNDIYLRDLVTATTELISLSSSGSQANDIGYDAVVSAGGRYVAWSSDATNLVSGDTNGVQDIFLRDRHLATTIRVSESASGVQANDSSFSVAISSDGVHVSYASWASNLVTSDTNQADDVFLYEV